MENIELKRFINVLLKKEELNDVEKQDVLFNSDVMDYIVNRLNNRSFYKIMSLLGNPKEFIEQRLLLEDNAIKNIENIDKKVSLDIIAQKYFGDYANNILFSIEAILGRIDTKGEFRSNFSNEIINFLRYLYNSLKNGNNLTDIRELVDKIDLFQSEFKEDNIMEFIEKLFLLTQKDFSKEIEDSLNSNRMLENIDPSIVKDKDGREVEFYTLQAQTNEQKDFCILVRTNSIEEYMFSEDACDKFRDNLSNRRYLSYSLVNDECYSGFCQKHRIMFGYFGFGSNYLMSANTHDGQTNQYTLKDNFFVMKQQYLSLNDFFNKTVKYNEIVLSNSEVLMPSCIIVNETVPDDEVVTIASCMNIPIVYLDPQYYKEHEAIDPIPVDEKMRDWYRHDDYLDYSLADIVKYDLQNV